MIDITLLGTSALVPLPERAETAAALTCAGHTILFDCGEGTQSAARKARVSLLKADMIALTHYHGDHIFGLPGLMQTMGIMGRAEPLYITGPEGLREALAPIVSLAGWLPYELRLTELPADGLRLAEQMPGWPEGARLSAFQTAHRVPSQGYCFQLDRAGSFQPQAARALGVPTELWGRLQRGEAVQVDGALVTPQQVLGAPRRGLKFVFSGDTTPCEALERSARDADLLICEATYGENDQAQLALDHGHMTFAQAAQLARDAGARRLWLAHYSQMIKDPAQYLPNARAFFPDAVCGEDGMSITLRFEK